MRARLTWFMVLSLCAVGGAPVAAADTRGPCAPGKSTPEIPGFAAAEVVDKPRPYYPDRALDEWGEGWVRLEFTVGPDGRVRDAAVTDAIGAKEFVIHTVGTLSRWRFNRRRATAFLSNRISARRR